MGKTVLSQPFSTTSLMIELKASQLLLIMKRGGGCIAQWKLSCFPPSTRWDFFSLPLSLWTVLRTNPSSAKQWISQMLLAVTYRAKYYKKMKIRIFMLDPLFRCDQIVYLVVAMRHLHSPPPLEFKPKNIMSENCALPAHSCLNSLGFTGQGIASLRFD